MKISNIKRAVVGCLPHPLGGVSSFVYRLAEKNMVSVVIDTYPSNCKLETNFYSGDVVFKKNLLYLFFYLAFNKISNIIFFNFSTIRSLFLTLFIPKRGIIFELMLHNGVINKQNYPRFIVRFLLNKFDVIYAIGNVQYQYYKSLELDCNVVLSTSLLLLDNFSNNQTNFNYKYPAQSNKQKIVAFSGNLRSEYNLLLMLNYAKQRPNLLFAFFLYDMTESEFNKILSDFKLMNCSFYKDLLPFDLISNLQKCTHLIRPTTIDSFGLITAEAVQSGVKVLATDICERYRGVYLYNHSNDSCFSHFDDFIEERFERFKVSSSDISQFKFLE